MDSQQLIKEFIVSNIMNNSDGANLQDTDSLLESGIIDSLGILKLLAFLEQTFSVKLADNEVPVIHFLLEADNGDFLDSRIDVKLRRSIVSDDEFFSVATCQCANKQQQCAKQKITRPFHSFPHHDYFH